MNMCLRRFARRLPQPVQDRLRRIAGSRRIARLRRPLHWGTLRRLRPLSERYGFDRGTPVDRVYLDAFFALHATEITGRVLEVGAPMFTRRFGRGVVSVDVVDIDPRNDSATIVADLSDAGCLPRGAFDCIVVPQTLQYVSDPNTALANLWGALVPGGIVLLTVPTIAKLDHDIGDVESWRFLPRGLGRLVEVSCPEASVEIRAFGNVLAAVAILMGVAAEEMRDTEIAAVDPEYPVLVTAAISRARPT